MFVIRIGILRRPGGRVKEKGERHKMGRRAWGCWVLVCLIAAGCSRDDTERLAKVGRRMAASAEALGAECREGLGGGWSEVAAVAGHAGVEARVAARIHWDQALAGTAIQVQGTAGVVELHGSVRNLAQRRRAIDLAETTVGVEKVSDQLRITER